MTGIAIRGLILAALYLVLVGQLAADEIGLAVGCALCGLAWSLALRRVAHVRFRFSAAALGMAGRAVAGLPRAIAEVAPALLSPRRGSVRRQLLAHGARGSTGAGWRAAALLAVSLAPDRYALRWAPTGEAIEVHVLSMRSAPSHPS